MKLHDGLESEHRLRGCRTLAAAVGMNTDIGRQHRAQRLHVAAARSGEERLGELEAALLFHLEARSRLADVSARTRSELAAGRRVTLDGRGDLVEVQPEHVVQQEGRPLERRKTFQRKHQRQGDVFLFLLFDDGIGKPGADIRLALTSRRFQLIETEARDRAPQERLGFAYLAAVGLHPADEGLLHNILGVRDGAEHAVGHAHELWTQRVETRRCVLVW